jgi:hypothetical protein
MTAIILSKDSDGQKPYRYTGVVAIITTQYQIKLITRSNRIVPLDKDLVVNIMLEDVGK